MPEQQVPTPKPTSACHCPFCDATMAQASPFCAGCGVELKWCPSCGQAAAKNAVVCAACGASLP